MGAHIACYKIQALVIYYQTDMTVLYVINKYNKHDKKKINLKKKQM